MNKSRMQKKSFTVAILLSMLLLVGCGTSADIYSIELGKGAFMEITVDNAGILTTDADDYRYYFLKDTKIVYVGYLTGGVGLKDVLTPVITEQGNYCKYDVEKGQVVEIKK